MSGRATMMIAALVVLFAATTAAESADEPPAPSLSALRNSIWQAEQVRLDLCEHINAYANATCGAGREGEGKLNGEGEGMRCCSLVAAYEATACRCSVDEGAWGEGGMREVRVVEKEADATHGRRLAACGLDALGLGAEGTCTESRVASINFFPFLGQWRDPSLPNTKRRVIVDGWVARSAQLIFGAAEEQLEAVRPAGTPRAESQGEGGEEGESDPSTKAPLTVCERRMLGLSSACASAWLANSSVSTIVSCCRMVESASESGCLCDPGTVSQLGGEEQLDALARTIPDACGFNLIAGAECA